MTECDHNWCPWPHWETPPSLPPAHWQMCGKCKAPRVTIAGALDYLETLTEPFVLFYWQHCEPDALRLCSASASEPTAAAEE